MSCPSTVVAKMKTECEQWLNIVYMDHNPDPIASFPLPKLSKEDVLELTGAATTNELLKTTRGNGNGNQTIYSGVTAFGEIPVVSDTSNEIQITQQLNVGGFGHGAPSTWIKRAIPDHIRRGTCIQANDLFDHATKGQNILAVPMKINLKPDWDPKGKNFMNGQRIDSYYASTKVWSTKGYFCGSMITPLCDPRQITIIIQSGNGVIQSPFGLLPYRAGDLIQIPPNTPFCFYVKTGDVVRSINYYSKEDLVFPDKQLNVAVLNAVPFSPSIVVQCKYSYNEASKYPKRGEYMRVEQSDGLYHLYYFDECQTAFNWSKWVHQGPVIHKVNLMDNFERIGTNKGHKDPNIWLILGHSMDPWFGIAFITGESLIEVGGAEGGKITYPPAYFHVNGVHEKGETVLFGGEKGGYDARKGFADGDCLLHPGGVPHGADQDIYKYFITKAIVKYILEHEKRNGIIKQLVNRNKYERFDAMEEEKKQQRIGGYVKRMYAFDFEGNRYNDAKNVEFNVTRGVNAAIEVILNEDIALNNGKEYQVLGMPFGIGYLMVECRDIPAIPPCEYNSTFRKTTPIQYGMGVLPLIEDGNRYVKKVNKMFIKSAL